MFDLERFTEDCRAAVRGDKTHKAAREVVARAVADPAGFWPGSASRAGRKCRSSITRAI